MNQGISEFLAMPGDLGDWEGEYRAITHTCAVVARADRRLVKVEGERRLEMLDGLLTNRVRDLESHGRHAMLLTPKGGILTDLLVLPRSDHVLLDVPDRGLQNLLNAFHKYLPPIYATFADVSPELQRLSLNGPAAESAVEDALSIAVPDGDLGVQEFTAGGVSLLIVANRREAGGGVEIIVPTSAVRDVSASLLDAASERGGGASGSRALEILRMECGIPRYGVDITETTLVQETPLEEDAVSYDKGCYLGQEVVARVHFRGRVNRHLRPLRFVKTAPVAGTMIVHDEREVGVVTSSVVSPEFGPIGLGYVHREIAPPVDLTWRNEDDVGALSVLETPLRSRTV